MIKRIFQEQLHRKLSIFPAVSILGARQAGKTTLVKEELNGWKYFDLQRPSDRAPFEADPESRLEQLDSNFILDEVQTLPELFPVLRSFIDKKRNTKGQFVILGSASFELLKNISETLAGRIGFLELPPFQWIELCKSEKKIAMNELWYKGGYPEPFLMNDNSNILEWFDAYTRTFIERDLSSLGIDFDFHNMRKFMTMLAHVNAEQWNASKISSALGINYQTVNRYLYILEKSFLIRRIPAYHANLGKRLVKADKIYYRDSGLLHYFLGIRDEETLSVHPERGSSWESFCVEQIINSMNHFSPGAQFFHMRTSGGAEVDLIVDTGQEIFPFEIKLHSAPGKDLCRGLKSCMSDLKASSGFVVYPGKESYSLGDGVIAIPISELLEKVIPKGL